MKKLSEKITALLLSAITVFSVTGIATLGVGASSEAEIFANTTEKTSNSVESKEKTYSLDEIYTDFLFPHTDKTSEKTGNAPIKQAANANSDKTYSDFGFSQASEKDANDQLNNEETDNPLAGYTFINPSELVIGQINRNSQHKGYIRTIDNITSNVNQLDSSIDKLKRAFNDSELTESKAGQTHNIIPVDYDGDGVDELAYYSLYYSGNGCASLRIYKKIKVQNGSQVTYNWNRTCEKGITISKNNDMLDIEAQQSKGFTAMTAGDFDNDGQEELACYFPCANDGYGQPYIGIIDISESGQFDFNSMKKIPLSSVRTGLDNLQPGSKKKFEKYYMPVVALSTTSIRANGKDVNSQSFDDLVINVSIPRAYHDNNVNMNSCVAVFKYNSNTKNYDKAFSSDLKYGTKRMISTNSVDADLNGDGYNELVIAGMCESNLPSDNDKSTGNIERNKNQIQLIYWNGSSYKFVWKSPKDVEASGQVKVDRNCQEPIAITSGRYDPNVPLTLDYICVQGVVLGCKNTKVFGVETTPAKDTDANKAIIETKPYMEEKLFAEASFVTKYKTNISNLVKAKQNAFISTASSGKFYATSNLDSIVLLTGDEVKGASDKISYDIILLSCDEKGNWVVKAYDDYISHKDEDDQGTYASACFLDCDNDQMYYRYKGKSVGYSSPTLYSVVQTPPYYAENNDATISCTITHNTTSGVRLNWGVGGGVSIKEAGSGVIKYVGSYTHTVVRTQSTTLTLKTDQDYAVAFVVPVIFSYYDVWDPETQKWTDMVTTTILDATFAALPLDRYNSLVKDLSKEQRLKAPVISKDKLPPSSAGDPTGYFNSIEQIKERIIVKDFDQTFVTVNTDTKSKANTIGVTVNEEQTHGYSFSFNANILKVFTLNFDIGTVSINAKSIGISFSVTYSAIKASNTAKINDSTSGSYEKLKTMKSSIAHYQPEDYIYYSHAVAYSAIEFIINNPEEEISPDVSFNDMYILSFYTDNFPGKYPAETPEYFGVKSVSKSNDGKGNVVLGWKTKVNNPNRKPDAYNIYSKSINGDFLSLVNKEGPIYYSDSSNMKTYEIKNLGNTAKDLIFYIVPVYIKTSHSASGLNMEVTEGILSSGVVVNIDNFVEADGLKITKQPVSFYAGKTGEKATFTVEALDTTGDAEKITYQWQTYNSKTGEWKNVYQSHFSDEKEYSFTVTDKSYNVPIRCVVTKVLETSETYTVISDVVVVYKEHTHSYNENGFCKVCGKYEPAPRDGKTDVYQISNEGQLFWFAAMVNGDKTVADFNSSEPNADAVLLKDIDLKQKEWKPIKGYSGCFDGGNHKITGLSITAKEDNCGMFATASGATVKNLTLEGEMIISGGGSRYGSLIGKINGGKVVSVTSNVNVSNTDGSVAQHVGGIIGSVDNDTTTIEKCIYSGSLIIKDSTNCIGGIVGYASKGAAINNCANLGSVIALKQNAYVGGILGYLNNKSASVKKCYNYGNVSNNGITSFCGAIIGRVKSCNTSKITDNYYYDTVHGAFGENSEYKPKAEAKTKADFASGEIAYLLNNGVVDGKQVWYQNIDNAPTADEYPVYEGGTVYLNENTGKYTNFEAAASNMFDVDSEGNLVINTYEDLEKLAQAIRTEYEAYGSKSYILADNIFAEDASLWTQGIGSVEENKPFNGTFKGNGNCIVGLNIKSDQYGGLFEVIGESGLVSDLLLYDCDYVAPAKTAGGIAAVNNGTVDHCVSGVNLTSGVVYVDGKAIDRASLNSFINGELSGGLVAINNGTVKGSRNASVVDGSTCAGVAGENKGNIYGCANNGRVGSAKSGIAGGLVGVNTASLMSCYNSGVVTAKTDACKGSIVGLNNPSSSQSVQNIFYLTADSLNAVGKESLTGVDNTNTAVANSQVMQSIDFVEKLNGVSGNEIQWTNKSFFNNGYPVVKSRCINKLLLDAGNGITLEGAIQEGISVSYSKHEANDLELKMFKRLVKDKNISASYSLDIDDDGNFVPYELWCSDSYILTVPVDNDNIMLAMIDLSGQITYYEPDLVKEGKAEFSIAYPGSFAIVEKPTLMDVDFVNTGVAIGIPFLLAALSFAGVLLIVSKKRKSR